MDTATSEAGSFSFLRAVLSIYLIQFRQPHNKPKAAKSLGIMKTKLNGLCSFLPFFTAFIAFSTNHLTNFISGGIIKNIVSWAI